MRPAAVALMLAALLCGAADAQTAAQTDAPIVIAHRGASGYLPEHTLAGYELAIRLGADFIEPDLQLTRDGVLVAIHDETLQRTTDVAAKYAPRNGGYKVADFTLAEIKTLTVQPTGTAAASYPGFVPANPGFSVPTFDEVVALAQSQARSAGRLIGIYPEAKQADPAMEDQILATLRRGGYADLPGAVFIQSFSDATIRSLDAKQREQSIDLPMIVLGSAAVLPDGSARLRVRGAKLLELDEVASFAEGVGVIINNADAPITKAFVDQAHAAGLKVHGWTFAQPDAARAAIEYREYLELGLDGMFSNYPDLAAAARNAYVAARPAR